MDVNRLLRRGRSAHEQETPLGPLSPTEGWTMPGGWSIQMPVDWTQDESSQTNAWVPPDAVGRLSVLTVQARQSVEVDEQFAREHGRKMAAALRLPQPGPSSAVERLAPGHYAVTLSGKSRGRYTIATVHVFQPGMIVCAAWHSGSKTDPNRADGVAATRSVTPLAS
jgi:hypothetical protein